MLKTKDVFERKTDEFQPRDCVIEKVVELASLQRTTGRTVKQQNKDMKKTVLMLRTVTVLQLQFKAGRIRFGGCRCTDLHFLFEG